MRLAKIALIGAGNVAWHMAPLLEQQGFAITEVWSRTIEPATKLARRLYEAHATTATDFSASTAQLFLVAVPDHAVQELVQQMHFPPTAIVAHTSGSLPLEVLMPLGQQAGVWYPMQTFSKKKKPDLSQLPLFIEAYNADVLEHLADVAYAVTEKVYELSSEERKQLHIAAVFACNFTNHLLQLSSDLLEDIGFELPLLQPLINETMQKAEKLGPSAAQTGPAARGDSNTIAAHLQHLTKKQPKLAELYKQLSESIQKSTDEAGS